LAARNNVRLGAGYSIGYELQTVNNQPDNSLPYSVVVGRDISWISGACYPDGSGLPYAGAEEDIFCGGSFSGDSQLSLRAQHSCVVAGCLDQYFDASQSCYQGYSDSASDKPDNVAVNIQYSGLFLTCTDATAEEYVVSLTPAQMMTFTYTSVSNCNFQAEWIINIRGTGDVTITGDSFPAIAGGVIYNVIGARTVFVHDTQVNGHLLAVTATLNQTGGVIVGKVVAGSIVSALQINKQNTCPLPTPVTVPVVPSAPVQAGNPEFALVNADNLRNGDNVVFPDGSICKIQSMSGKSIKVNPAPSSNLEAFAVLHVTYNSTDSRPTPAMSAQSSPASVTQIAFALVAVLIALAL